MESKQIRSMYIRLNNKNELKEQQNNNKVKLTKLYRDYIDKIKNCEKKLSAVLTSNR